MAAQGNFAAAIPEYARVIAEEPSHANAHLSLGTALLQTGKDGPGFDHYAEAERLAPGDPLVAFVIGRAMISRGRPVEGLRELKRAVGLDPGFEPARRALAALEAPGGGAAPR